MPNRILKESICTSETIHKLTPQERDFFYRLIVVCDDYGRMDARPRILRTRCFPLDLDIVKDKDISLWLSRLREVGLLELYNVGEYPYFHMVTWERHQQIRAKRPKYPAPSEGAPAPETDGYHLISDDGTCSRNPIQSNPIQSTVEMSRTTSATSKGNNSLFTPETEPFRLASKLRDRIMGHNPKAKVPQVASGPFQAWCSHVDALLRIDGYTSAEIGAVIDWSQDDEFWQTNVLSTRSLRDHFDKLYARWKQGAKPKVVPIRNKAGENPGYMSQEEAIRANPDYA